MAVRDYLTATATEPFLNPERLMLEGQYFINWIASGQLPRPLYQMQAQTMNTLFRMERELGDLARMWKGVG